MVMRRIDMEDSRSVSDSDISSVEQQLGYRFPSDYRDFLKQCGGGRPTTDWCFEFEEDREYYPSPGCSDIHYFFSVELKDKSLALLKWCQAQAYDLPNGIASIAIDSGGNLIVISVRDFDEGYIYFADGEEFVDDHQNLRLCAHSFSEFLDGLHEWE